MYLLVLTAALCCYAALGAVLRILPGLDLGPAALGLAVGAPALTAVVARPAGGRLADRRDPAGVVAGGAGLMAAAAPLAFAGGTVPLVASRLAVGAGEGLMMSAAVAWLLRLAGPARSGRALGHIGLANYGGLTLGPLLAEALGSPDAVIAASALLPLGAVAVARTLPGPPPAAADDPPPLRGVAPAALRPGLGLFAVNVGYAGLITFGTGEARLVLPAFAVTVVLARTAGAAVPDRAGARRTLLVCAPLAAAGLAFIALGGAAPAVIAGAVVLGAGQALAVPALGLLVVGAVPEAARGAAAGAFFAFFDLGVGVGSPMLGLVARAGGATAALLAAALVVLAVPVVSRPSRAPTGRTPGRA